LEVKTTTLVKAWHKESNSEAQEEILTAQMTKKSNKKE
jgi:hypothetical protein